MELKVKKYTFNEVIGQNNIKYTVEDDIRVNRHCYGAAEVEHGHDYFEVEYVYEGRGVQIINGVPYDVEAGTIIVMVPGDTHSYYSLENMRIFNLCFSAMNKAMHYCDFSKSMVISLDSFFRIEIEQLFYLLETELMEKKYQYHETVWRLLELIMIAISRNQSNIIHSDPVWGNIISYIYANINNISLSKVADIMGVSTSYFCRAFKKKFSTTFHQYVVNVRVQLAKKLLLHSTKSLSQIALEVGYNSECCFYQDFKKITGTTPKKYYQEVKENFKENIV